MIGRHNLLTTIRQEFPLILNSVLAPLAVGAFVFLYAAGIYLPRLNLCLLGLTALAAGAAFLHLNEPWRFYRAIGNLRRSWLSREAFCFGGFASLQFAYILAASGAIFPGFARWLGLLAAAAGLAAIFSTGMIYRLSHRPAWRHWTATAHLFAAGAVSGALFVHGFLLPAYFITAAFARAVALAALALAMLFFGLRLMDYRRSGPEGAMTLSLLLNDFRGYTLTRAAVGWLLPAGLLLSGQAGSRLALAAVLLGEFFDRSLFYAAVVPAPQPAPGTGVRSEIDPWQPEYNFGRIPLGQKKDYHQPATRTAGGDEKIIPTTCVNNCGGKCLLRAHVKDGVITHLTSDNISDDTSLLSPQLRACAKGRAHLQRVYHPDRLRYPLKRIGERGEGKFVRISWEEALATVAGELQRIKSTYGDSAILDLSHTGSFGGKLHYRAVDRFLNLFGCRTVLYGYYSCEATDVITEHMCGTGLTGNDRADLLNSNLIILWGFNPADGVRGTNTSWFIARAREKGARVVCIDPLYTDTTATLADQWIPIRPGTDTAMMAAMAYVIITAGRHAVKFLADFTVGFEKFRDYVLGGSDGIPKTPEWAENICGVPTAAITELAMAYADAKPGAILCGWSLQRTAYGEQPVRLAITLAALTGNMGIPGGSVGGVDYSQTPNLPGLPVLPEPNPAARVPVYVWADLILKGKAGGFPSDIKAVYMVGGNLLNQGANVNKNIAALRQVEFIACHEQFMTPTAKFADIVLPACTFLERFDICPPGTAQGNYLLFANQVIEPLYESKSDYAIFAALADRLGFGAAYTEGKTEEDWLRSFVAQSPVPDYEEFKRTGIYRDKRKRPYIAFTDQLQGGKPFDTPSGKIEIYSERLAALNDPLIPPIPQHIDPWEGPADPLSAEYPLQLVTAHSKQRVHSSHDNNPLLRAIEPHGVWINPRDAEPRGIAGGSLVRVFNARGAIIIPARVTERIMPGVVNIYQGSWYSPDAEGNDWGGNPNVLNNDRPTPFARASTTHTTLVEIEPYQAKNHRGGDRIA